MQYLLLDLTFSQLKGFELIKAVHLDPIPFDMERDLLTPTYKKKRSQLLKYYKVQIFLFHPSWNMEKVVRVTISCAMFSNSTISLTYIYVLISMLMQFVYFTECH